MHFSLFEVVLLIGITQGFAVSLLIWINKRADYSKLLLSAILVVFNLLCCKILLHTTGLWQTSFFRYFPSSFELLIQPLIWFYVQSLIFQNFKITKSKVIHFLPFFLFISYSVLVFFSTQQTNEFTTKDLIANKLHFDKVKAVEDILSIISSIIYLVLGLKFVVSYQKWLQNNTSNTDFQTFKWLKVIIPIFVLLVLILAFVIGNEFLFGVKNSNFIYWQLFFVYMAFVVYFLGLKGYSLNPLKLNEETNISLNTENPLKNDELDKLRSIILYEFEHRKAHLDPELNIQKLAESINMNPNLVSQVINQSFKKSFRTLVNDFRILEVKNKMANPASKKYTLVGLAFESGFNSEASFYRIFKASEGISPKTFFDSLKN